MNLKENLRPMLELESGSNDPMAYMLTIALIQVVASGSDLNVAVVAKDLVIQFFFGGVIGFAFGKFSVWLINKIGRTKGHKMIESTMKDIESTFDKSAEKLLADLVSEVEL